ncbi:MAG: hypothetical protein A3B70_03615 [Deltaproteobacteria bacterium RIFCSPHIGHO2_02_FULL_40_11]|nr:MAG: hypothetical protein A3B70_03615 [Deltaproteobacteria bacterium RIFCSPHIGHO2_02_FULL_40_11]
MWIKTTLVWLVCVAGFGTGFYFYFRLFRYLQTGKSENRFDQIPQRLKNILIGVLGQKKMFKDFLPGLLHAFIFWGFIIISIGTIEMILEGLFPGFNLSFLGISIYSGILFFQDVFYTLVLTAVLFFFFRRIVLKPKRLTPLSAHSAWDAYFILTLILLIVTSSLTMGGARLLIEAHPWDHWRPVSFLIASFLNTTSPSQAGLFWISEISWWIHFLVVLGFFMYLPFSKHLHVMAAAPNIFFSRLTPRGRLKKINLEDESQTSFGAGKLEELPWKAILDGYACTECGRCNEFCPTYNTNKPLKPRSLIVNLRHHAEKKGHALYTKNEASEELKKDMIQDVFTEDAIWDCTSCGACVEACPVYIEHVDHIIEMRRSLVLMQGKMEPEAQAVFNNWENHSNPWGLPQATRGDWAKDLGIPLLKDNANVEYLYYVGCAASFDKQAQKIAVSFSKLLQKAGVSFGILGEEEKCNGESCRRLGNEYLAQQMIQDNISVLKKYNVKKILVNCPHCLNTLKNEYPDFDAHFEVTHHSVFLKKLMDEGKLKLRSHSREGGNLLDKITFHDPCYLARYNDITEAPRDLLQLSSGEKPLEMERNRKKGFCCGAGGGRMWLEEKRGSRINVNRVEEAISTGAKTIAASCPFCITMLQDGLNAKNKETEIQTKDISEILFSAVE